MSSEQKAKPDGQKTSQDIANIQPPNKPQHSSTRSETQKPTAAAADKPQSPVRVSEAVPLSSSPTPAMAPSQPITPTAVAPIAAAAPLSGAAADNSNEKLKSSESPSVSNANTRYVG